MRDNCVDNGSGEGGGKFDNVYNYSYVYPYIFFVGLLTSSAACGRIVGGGIVSAIVIAVIQGLHDQDLLCFIG